MDHDLVKKIIGKKRQCIFISPHFDDAVLSCGTLLSQLSGKTSITIVNVFTKAHKKPYTLSARMFLRESGMSDATALYDERLAEDKRALSHFNARVINLGLEDAIFRLKKQPGFLARILPEFGHIYPTYQWHVVKAIASQDHAVSELTNALKKFADKNTIVFAPYAIGHHVDHQIVRKVCEKLFTNLILYSDFPYNVRNNTYGTAGKDQERYTLRTNPMRKNKIIEAYKTQLNGLFPEGKIPEHQEVYFVSKKI